MHLKDGREAPNRGHGFGHELMSSRVARVNQGPTQGPVCTLQSAAYYGMQVSTDQKVGGSNPSERADETPGHEVDDLGFLLV